MSGARYRPRRRLRSELPQLILILSLPAAIYLAFPKGAVGFVPQVRPSQSDVVNAMIVLDADREAKLLASARASWQSDSSSRRGTRANLLSCDFSHVNDRISAGIRPNTPGRLEEVVEYEVTPVRRGVAAEAPSVLDPEPPVTAPPAFPKTEFLKLKETANDTATGT